MATFDVLLPVKNGAAYLAESIRSIQDQTFGDWRLLILDHGSTDGSDRLAHVLADGDSRIEVHSVPQANGLAGLLNAGLGLCDCRYVVRHDADDISLPGRMEAVKATFDESPKLVVVGGQAIAIDSAGRPIYQLRKPTSPTAIAAATFFYNPVIHPAAALNFDAINRLNGVYGYDIMGHVPGHESIFVPGLAEDYVLFGQLALMEPCANLPFPLIQYRMHGGSVSKKDAREQIEVSLQISRFLAKSFCLRTGCETFDPAPFCSHADYVFDFRADDYADDFERMARALRLGLGQSPEVDRELAFRWVLASRRHAAMIARMLRFACRHGTSRSERLTVRNWLLRHVRNGKYIYRAEPEDRLDFSDAGEPVSVQ